MASEQQFPVGIGASAGGVQALNQMLAHTPADTGLAFIVVMHQSPEYATELPEILARQTRMPVALAANGSAVEPNHVYVAPSNASVVFEGGKLSLRPLDANGRHRPVDALFSSLGQQLGDSAVGVILSGSGADGTLGAKAVKEHGGLTIAQAADGGESQHRGMPEAAIAAGIVDLVLPVEQIGGRLMQLVHSYKDVESQAARSAEESDSRSLYNTIYQLLLQQVGHDFSGYKQRTFMRRVHRRMQVLQVLQLDEYVRRLQDNPEEVTALFHDLLIGVTNFFRDREAFESLATMVVPKLFEGRRANDTIRIWCPGCATGEEVYSIAILLREHLDQIQSPPKVQIFATDIDEHALTVARTGRYPGVLLEQLSAERLRRFFSGDQVSYAVNKESRNTRICSRRSTSAIASFNAATTSTCRCSFRCWACCVVPVAPIRGARTARSRSTCGAASSRASWIASRRHT